MYTRKGDDQQAQSKSLTSHLVCIINFIHIEASVMQWLVHSPCRPGVAGSIPGFSSPSDGTINRCPVSI